MGVRGGVGVANGGGVAEVDGEGVASGEAGEDGLGQEKGRSYLHSKKKRMLVTCLNLHQARLPLPQIWLAVA